MKGLRRRNTAAIFENAIEGIFQRTPPGKYLDANPSLARMSGILVSQELMESIADIGQELYVQPERQRSIQLGRWKNRASWRGSRLKCIARTAAGSGFP